MNTAAAPIWTEISASLRRMKAASVGDLEDLVRRALDDDDGDIDKRVTAKDALLELTIRAARNERKGKP